MEFLKFRGDDDFYILANDFDKFFKTLVNKGYLRRAPHRCSNCRNFNTFEFKQKKLNIRRPVTENTIYERNGVDYTFSYICKKYINFVNNSFNLHKM